MPVPEPLTVLGLAAWRDGARFDGWNEHFAFGRWRYGAESALATPVGAPPAEGILGCGVNPAE